MSDYTPVSIETVDQQILDRVWGEEIIVAETDKYLGKVLQYKAGCAGGLQYHVEKDETFYLFSGRAWVDYDDGSGALVRIEMTPGDSFHIPPGAVHRFEAIEDCIVFEASTPHYDDRVRMEEYYGVEVIGDAYGLETTR